MVLVFTNDDSKNKLKIQNKKADQSVVDKYEIIT